MSSDCIVNLSANGQEVDLYLGSKGYLAQAGAKVAQAARTVQEGEGRPLIYMSDFLTVCSGLDFGPCSLEGADLSAIPHIYEIEIRDNGEPIVSYRQGDNPRRSFNVGHFIKKVNKARRSANYPYKMLRQPLVQPEPETDRPYTKQERAKIAETIVNQLGGYGPLRAMIGAKNFTLLNSPAGLKFDFKGSRKANKCQVVYNPGSDTYNFELYYFTPVKYAHWPKVYSVEGCYFDMLQDLFTGYTGLTLTL